jgi:hypothetical protein
MTNWDEYAKAYPCLRSGYCCKKQPCGFGEWNEDKSACKHLVGGRPGEYACAIYDDIKKTPGWEISPAFGAGCGSPLFNTDREEAKRNGKQKSGSGGVRLGDAEDR